MKLLIADDHTLFRDALVQYIERASPQTEITLAKDFYQAKECMIRRPDQDLIILDLRMPGMNGLEGVKFLRENYPERRLALMSGVAEEADIRNALALGVVGYFPKTLSGKALLKGILQVLDGKPYIPMDDSGENLLPSYYNDAPTSADKIVKEKSEKKEHIIFTTRESEVLSFLINGASNKEIASELGLQIVTVKLHIRSICRKLNAKNRTQAALKARELGVLPSAKIS